MLRFTFVLLAGLVVAGCQLETRAVLKASQVRATASGAGSTTVVVDVAVQYPNRNFCNDYWERTVEVLRKQFAQARYIECKRVGGKSFGIYKVPTQIVKTPADGSADPDGSTVAPETRYTARPHRKNYIYTTYSFEPNNPAALGFAEVTPHEIKFQLSVRYDLGKLSDSRITLAYTGLSFWQIYSTTESAPLRTTDYEPEIFWERDIGGHPSRLRIGVVHESNGESGDGETGRACVRYWSKIPMSIQLRPTAPRHCTGRPTGMNWKRQNF